MKLLTFMDLEEISELTQYKDERMNKAKERLAFEVTKLVHGEEKALLAQKQAQAAFGTGNVEDMPQIEVPAGTPVPDILLMANAVKSKGEARKLIDSNGVSINDTKLGSGNYNIPEDVEKQGSFVLHKGKKVHINVIIK